MSSWGAFGLIANDGKVDNLITATKLLNQRIKDIMCARAKAGMADTSPTLVDIERTHILYVNAHFKPYAAIGFEYNKVRTQSGNAAFGGGVTFSIPQFGDFFHDMVCRVVLDQVQAAPGTLPTLPVTDAAKPSIWYTLLSNVPAGAVGDAYNNLIRYCEYPGNRLFKNVKFDVNGNPIDQYDTTIPIMLEKFCVPVNKRTGFDRLVGQEVPVEGYKQLSLDVVYDGDSANTPTGISSFEKKQSNQTVGLFSTATSGRTFTNTTLNAAANVVGAVGVGVGGMLPTTTQGRLFSQYNVSREQVSVVCGPQTPKPIQPPLEIWNKLRFWFNDDVRLSIASVSIPFGQRYISIDLANQSDLLYEVPSVGYSISPTGVTLPYVNLDNLSTVSTAVAVHIQPTQITPYLNQNGLGTQGISTMELYINNIFVNPEIHDIYIKRIGFSLIRVYRYQTQNVSAATDDVLLSNLKWPIEYMFVGLRPKYNVTAPTTATNLTTATVTAGNPNIWRDWHRLTRMVDAVNADGMANFLGGTGYGAGTTNVPANVGSFPPGVANNGGGTLGTAIGIPQPITSLNTSTGNNLVSSFGSNAAQYWLPVPTVDTLGLSSHGITVYDGYSDKFFNQYAPFHYGGAALNTPEDVGALFVNLCLFPRSYQPSGHLNISRARETYLKYTSSYIGSNSTADMLVVGVAINFLLITDGSAVLRYST